jgi:hypothetical protein
VKDVTLRSEVGVTTTREQSIHPSIKSQGPNTAINSISYYDREYSSSIYRAGLGVCTSTRWTRTQPKTGHSKSKSLSNHHNHHNHHNATDGGSELVAHLECSRGCQYRYGNRSANQEKAHVGPVPAGFTSELGPESWSIWYNTVEVLRMYSVL